MKGLGKDIEDIVTDGENNWWVSQSGYDPDGDVPANHKAVYKSSSISPEGPFPAILVHCTLGCKKLDEDGNPTYYGGTIPLVGKIYQYESDDSSFYIALPVDFAKLAEVGTPVCWMVDQYLTNSW